MARELGLSKESAEARKPSKPKGDDMIDLRGVWLDHAYEVGVVVH